MRMWLSKPLYELLPYFYMAAGLLMLGAAFYLRDGYWPAISLFLGASSLAAGAIVWWRRRAFRQHPAARRPGQTG